MDIDVGRPREHKKRDMWANIPFQKRQEIANRIRKMPDSNEKIICSLAFIDGLSTTDIAYFCKDNLIYSRNHRPYSRRRILQIIAEYVPEYNQYRKKPKQKRDYTDHYKLLWKNRTAKKECCYCGSKERIEIHHMIPVFLRGTEDSRNIVFVCHSCHRNLTDYQRELYPEMFKKGETNDTV